MNCQQMHAPTWKSYSNTNNMFLRALQWGWWGAWTALHIQVILNFEGVLFFCLKGFKISRLQWRVTINCIFKFFAMVLSDYTYQLLIISYVLANDHDLVTVPVWLSPQDHQQRQPHCQCSWLGPDWPAGPHFSRLLMTSWALGKDIGRDIPFHVGLHTLDTIQLINLNLKLQSHVVRQCQSGAWNVACTSSRKAQYCTQCLQHISYLMSVNVLHPIKFCWYQEK